MRLRCANSAPHLQSPVTAVTVRQTAAKGPSPHWRLRSASFATVREATASDRGLLDAWNMHRARAVNDVHLTTRRVEASQLPSQRLRCVGRGVRRRPAADGRIRATSSQRGAERAPSHPYATPHRRPDRRCGGAPADADRGTAIPAATVRTASETPKTPRYETHGAATGVERLRCASRSTVR
jgi:hypothetical protein